MTPLGLAGVALKLNDGSLAAAALERARLRIRPRRFFAGAHHRYWGGAAEARRPSWLSLGDVQ